MLSTQTPYARIVVNHSQRCNMHCTWCHEEGMQGTSNLAVLPPPELQREAALLHDLGIKKFKIVGGEPTLRRDLPEIISRLRSLDEDLDISMVTNGTRLSRHVKAYREAGLDRVNVSLFSLRPEYFVEHVGPLHLLRQAISGIDAAIEEGIAGKLNHVYHDFDDLERVIAFAEERAIRINVLNQIPSISSPEHMPVADLLRVVRALPIIAERVEEDPYSLAVTVFTTRSGVEIEVKHQELGEQRKFRACRTCPAASICREGIYAIRVTPAGMLQPCIVRDDNTFDLRAAESIAEVASFLQAL